MDFLLLALGLQLLILFFLFLTGFSSTATKTHPLTALAAWVRKVAGEICPSSNRTGIPGLIQTKAGRLDATELAACTAWESPQVSGSEICAECEETDSGEGPSPAAHSPWRGYQSFKRAVTGSWIFLKRFHWRRNGRSFGQRQCGHLRPNPASPSLKVPESTLYVPIRRGSIAEPTQLSPRVRPPVSRRVLIHPDFSPAARAILAYKLQMIDRRIKSRRQATMPSPIFENPTAEDAVWA